MWYTTTIRGRGSRYKRFELHSKKSATLYESEGCLAASPLGIECRTSWRRSSSQASAKPASRRRSASWVPRPVGIIGGQVARPASLVPEALGLRPTPIAYAKHCSTGSCRRPRQYLPRSFRYRRALPRSAVARRGARHARGIARRWSLKCCGATSRR